jgi:hypothetical protein
LIYTFALPKILAHGLARRLSGGRWGRPVVSWQSLTRQLRDI